MLGLHSSSTCVAGVMRVVAIGLLDDGDITRES